MKRDEVKKLFQHNTKEAAIYLLIRTAFSNHKTDFNIVKFTEAYSQPHRYYHTWKHIEDMIMDLIDSQQSIESNFIDDKLIIATVYHDFVYDPKANDNEEKSAKELLKNWKGSDNDLLIISSMIMSTKTHIPSSELSEQFIKLDLNIFTKSLTEILNYNKQIFKEYQFADWTKYHYGRLYVLNKLKQQCSQQGMSGIEVGLMQLIDCFESITPKIGVFTGSFNPFHIGHQNILDKAEKLFDKVIIARGINADKKNDDFRMLPKHLEYHQQEMYHGLVTDFLKELKYPITLIRGLRNAKDFEYEYSMCQYIKDIGKDTGTDIPTTFFICDREFTHVSSSDIKKLPKKEQEMYLTFNKQEK